MTDQSWPTADFQCGTEAIRQNVMKTMQHGIMAQTTPDVKEANPPGDISPTCKNKDVFKYKHLAITVLYRLETQCTCQNGADLTCSNGVGCNSSKIIFCGVSAGSSTCTGHA
ncbi:hypothetical protein PtB15_12B75 [Puccinia triticina]|nr:hypothetical protein PtB15_12B75 [Puccinia triticina]